jgi:sugar lactone lactonase YvrE
MQTGWSVAVPCGCELGERPVWDDAASTLWWVDVHAGRLHRVDAGGAHTIHALEPPVGAVGLARDGVVVAAGDVVQVLDSAGRIVRSEIAIGIPAGGRFNDGAVDPAGRFLIGTTESAPGRADGRLFRVSPAGDVELLLDGVVESNGLGWSPDGATMYYVDSGEPAVRRYRYDDQTRALSRLHDLVVFAEADGVPDGLVVDDSGDVWVAMWDGAAVRRHAATGDLREVFRTPVSRPTCPVIAAGKVLYLATGWEGMSDTARAAEPWAGHLLRRSVDARPAPTARFAC